MLPVGPSAIEDVGPDKAITQIYFEYQQRGILMTVQVIHTSGKELPNGGVFDIQKVEHIAILGITRETWKIVVTPKHVSSSINPTQPLNPETLNRRNSSLSIKVCFYPLMVDSCTLHATLS
jgi:hypothetical protein